MAFRIHTPDTISIPNANLKPPPYTNVQQTGIFSTNLFHLLRPVLKLGHWGVFATLPLYAARTQQWSLPLELFLGRPGPQGGPMEPVPFEELWNRLKETCE